METVLVEWFIRRGPKAAAAFAEYRKPVPQGTSGFIDETLHRATLDGPEPAVVYINIGHWHGQEDFFRHFKNARPAFLLERRNSKLASDGATGLATHRDCGVLVDVPRSGKDS
jgi:hypothetical protein